METYCHIIGSTPEKDITRFVNGGRFPELSEPGKKLVVAAVNSGDGNGILTGNTTIINAYTGSVITFGLSDCFVYDTRRFKLLSL